VIKGESKSELKSIKNAMSSHLQQKLNFKTKEYENNTDSADLNDVNSYEISISSRKQINTNTKIIERPITGFTTLKIPSTTTANGRNEYEVNNDEISKSTTITTNKKKSIVLNKFLNKTARHRKRLGICIFIFYVYTILFKDFHQKGM
jgi:hypothetical protein